MKVARNEKRKKLHWFSYYKNIANFEAFWRDKKFSKNLLFLGSARVLQEMKSNLKTDLQIALFGLENMGKMASAKKNTFFFFLTIKEPLNYSRSIYLEM